MSERRRRRRGSAESGSGSEESESEEVKEMNPPESGPEHAESHDEYESAEEETVLKSDGEIGDQQEDVEFIDGDGGGEELFPGLERQQGDDNRVMGRKIQKTWRMMGKKRT